MTTTVASQALFMLNGKLVEQSATRLSEKLLENVALSDRGRLDRVCRMLLGRTAEPDELEMWEAFLMRYQLAASVQSELPNVRRQLA